MEQRTFEEVDTVGRKASKLGLSHDNESAILVLDGAKRFYRAFANYQIGLVSVEMEKLTGSAKSDALSRLWVDTFTHFQNLGSALQKFGPIDKSIENEIATEIAAEKLAAGEVVEEQKFDKIDEEMNRMLGGKPIEPPADEDEDDEEDAA